MKTEVTAETISHYRIISKRGAGGMGEVYLAEDTNLDRKVAIQFLPPDAVANEQARKRLVREARVAAKLDSLRSERKFADLVSRVGLVR